MKPTAQDLANEIFMSQSYAAHLVVEGASDFAVFKQTRIDPIGLNIIPAHGKPIVLECMKIIENTKPQKSKPEKPHVHYFVDRDYEIALSKIASSPSLTSTDEKDFECQMLKSTAFDKIANELICDKKLKKENYSHQDFKKLIEKAASIIGALRFQSEKSNASFNFKDMQPNKFFDGKKIAIDTKKLASHLDGKNQGKKITDIVILKAIEDTKKYPYFTSPYLLCSGHDMILLISAALKNEWKPKSLETSIEPATIESMLRLAYCENFKNADCYKKIHTWLIEKTGRNDILCQPIF